MDDLAKKKEAGLRKKGEGGGDIYGREKAIRKRKGKENGEGDGRNNDKK